MNLNMCKKKKLDLEIVLFLQKKQFLPINLRDEAFDRYFILQFNYGYPSFQCL